MYKVFVGFEACSALQQTVEHIDALVARHHGSATGRLHPLHVTVMTPRNVHDRERAQLAQWVEEFNTQYRELSCRIESLTEVERKHRKYFVAKLKGQQLTEAIRHFHEELGVRLSWERRQFEGVDPHITLFSSKGLRIPIFKCVARDARRLEVPTEITLPQLFVHVRKGHKEVPRRARVRDAVQGWYPQ